MASVAVKRKSDFLLQAAMGKISKEPVAKDCKSPRQEEEKADRAATAFFAQAQSHTQAPSLQLQLSAAPSKVDIGSCAQQITSLVKQGVAVVEKLDFSPLNAECSPRYLSLKEFAPLRDALTALRKLATTIKEEQLPHWKAACLPILHALLAKLQKCGMASYKALFTKLQEEADTPAKRREGVDYECELVIAAAHFDKIKEGNRRKLFEMLSLLLNLPRSKSAESGAPQPTQKEQETFRFLCDLSAWEEERALASSGSGL